jgi:uncharacterized Tic20 family protein
METIGKNTTSFGVSLAITSILSAILVLIKESSQTVLGLMKNMTGHHWITHGLIAVIAFFVIGWGLGKTNNGEGLKMTPDRLITILVGAIVLSGLIIAGFYLLED